ERSFGEVQPTGDSRLGPLGESQDRLILVQSLQSKILQTQDVIDFYCVHTDLHVVWLIVNRVQILLTRHYRLQNFEGMLGAVLIYEDRMLVHPVIASLVEVHLSPPSPPAENPR